MFFNILNFYKRKVIKLFGVTFYSKSIYRFKIVRKFLFLTITTPNYATITTLSDRVTKLEQQHINDKSMLISMLNQNILKSKFVHFVNNDKFIQPYISLINSHFDNNEHIFLCKYQKNYLPFPKGNNVYQIADKDIYILKFAKHNKFIVQSFHDAEILNFLYKNKDVLSRAAWFLWGGDLYNARRNEIEDTVKKIVPIISCCVEEDYHSAVKVFGGKHIYVKATVPSPIDRTTVLKYQNKSNSRHPIKIQINNSANKTTIEMLNILSKFKDENISISTILSYGDLTYKQEIIEVGTRIFGSKFNYLDKYMSGDDYTKILADNDILVMYQNRQEGLGNIVTSLALGCKCFIRHDISSLSLLKELGLEAFDSREIEKLTFEELKEYSVNIKETNMQNAIKVFDEEYLAKQWNDLFNELEKLK